MSTLVASWLRVMCRNVTLTRTRLNRSSDVHRSRKQQQTGRGKAVTRRSPPRLGMFYRNCCCSHQPRTSKTHVCSVLHCKQVPLSGSPSFSALRLCTWQVSVARPPAVPCWGPSARQPTRRPCQQTRCTDPAAKPLWQCPSCTTLWRHGWSLTQPPRTQTVTLQCSPPPRHARPNATRT